MGIRPTLLLFTAWLCCSIAALDAFSLKKNFNEMWKFGCKEKSSHNDSDKEGFAPFKLVTVHCRRNVSPSTFTYAKCKKRCKDPIKKDGVGMTKRKQKLYMQQDVMNERTFTVRMNGKLHSFTRQLPISCRCVRKPGT